MGRRVGVVGRWGWRSSGCSGRRSGGGRRRAPVICWEPTMTGSTLVFATGEGCTSWMHDASPARVTRSGGNSMWSSRREACCYLLFRCVEPAFVEDAHAQHPRQQTLAHEGW